MKKNLIILAGMAMLISAVSCSIEESKIDPIPADPRVPMTFTAGEFTKTSLVPGDNTVLWSAGDAISIFDGTSNNEFTLTEGAGSASAKFEGEAVPDQKYYALYPYSASATFSGTVITSSLPAEQQYVGATFDTMLNPSVAVADENNNLAFYNVASVLQINVSGLQSKSVREIQISADKSLTGEYTVDMLGDAFSAAVSGTEISGLRLLVDSANMDTDPDFGGSISCYAVVLPGTYANLKISVIYSDNSYSEKSFENVTLVASDGNYVNVDASLATPNDDGLYGLYQAGVDIEIGGKLYNKSEYGDATLYEENSEITARPATRIAFIGDNVTLNFGAATNRTIYVGNDIEKRSLFYFNNYIRLVPFTDTESANEPEYFVLSNLEVAPVEASTNNYYININGSGNFAYVCIDNCKFDLTKNVLAITSKDGRTIDELFITDSEFNILPDDTQKFIVGTDASSRNATKMVIQNNIFYSTNLGTSNARLFFLQGLDLESLVLSNNTFYNIEGYSSMNFILNVNSITNLEAANNLIYNSVTNNDSNWSLIRCVASYPILGNASDNMNFSMATYDANDVEAGTSETRYCTCNLFYNSSLKDVSTYTETITNTIKNNGINPFSTENYEDGIFIPSDEYASYGAQR